MEFIIFVLMTVILILLIIGYALLEMVSDAEDEAEEMYREWVKERERKKRTDDIQ